MAAKKLIRKSRRVGAYSSDASLRNIDERTAEGKLMRAVRDDLVRHMGGAPSYPEQLLIQAIAMKAVRLSHFAQKLLAGDAERTDERFLAFSNSLRLDLALLGMKAPRAELPSLAQYLDGKSK